MIVGIPSSFDNNILEEAVWGVFKKNWDCSSGMRNPSLSSFESKRKDHCEVVNRKDSLHIPRNKKSSSRSILPCWIFLRVLIFSSTKNCTLITEAFGTNTKN